MEIEMGSRERAIQHLRTAVDPISAPYNSTEAYRAKDELAYLLSQVPLGTSRPVRIIVVGAGLSGLAFAREVEVGTLQNVQLEIFEKNSGVGGTWFENRYPGCACDIPVHNYQYSWAPYPFFHSYYASSDEIRRYIELVADQHHLRQYVRLSHMVTGARWVEGRQVWEVDVRQTDGSELVAAPRSGAENLVGETVTKECDFLINATGFVNNWKWPTIPGRETFRGEMVHTAAWDSRVDWTDKRVAIIGNGSSGVQVLPAILDKARKVTMFMRSPTWITTGFAQAYAGPGGTNVEFSEEQKALWAADPDAYLTYRKAVEREINAHFGVYLRDTEYQKTAKQIAMENLDKRLASRPDLIKLLTPEFAVGCRRLTPGNGFLEALTSPKCDVVWGEIDSFTPMGIKSASGVETDVDVIICATGFDISFSPRFPIVGRRGINLQDKWDETPEAYLSLAAADMPNYLVYLGPASPVGHGSMVTAIEMITSYMVDLIHKMQTENYGVMVVKSHIPHAYRQHCLAWLEKSSWNTGCASTYKNGTKDGALASLHPGSRLHFFRLLQTRRYEDFDWTGLSADPELTFAWHANGFSLEETAVDRKYDLTYFLKPIPSERHIVPPQNVNRSNAEPGRGLESRVTVDVEETIKNGVSIHAAEVVENGGPPEEQVVLS